MARPLRLEFPGALYHVTSRGDRREPIYEGDADRHAFLRTLDEVCDTYNWVCHAYCLMGNHYHLVIETPEGNLSKGMRQLNGVYTQTFNRLHCRVGHVFQGRYKAILVEKEGYLLELARYVVLNPVRAGIVKTPLEWLWSSYRATLGYPASLDALRTDWVNQTSPWESLRNQVYLGSEAFVSEMQEHVAGDEVLSEVPSRQRRAPAKPLGYFAQAAGSRDEAISLAYASGGYSMQSIGDFFGLHYSRVSRIIRKAKDKT